MVKLIRQILDVFYPLVSKIFDKTTYYYAACGTGNLVLSWILFFIFFQFVFQKKIFYVEFINYSLSAYSLSSFVCFVISFSVGFLLMKYVVPNADPRFKPRFKPPTKKPWFKPRFERTDLNPGFKPCCLCSGT